MTNSMSVRLTLAEFSAGFSGLMLAAVALGLPGLLIPVAFVAGLSIALLLAERAHWFRLLALLFLLAGTGVGGWMVYSVVADLESGAPVNWESAINLRIVVVLLVFCLLFLFCSRRARAKLRESEAHSTGD